jgi:Flp pilus assembly protein TadG
VSGASRTEQLGSERGAILVQVATALFVFTMLSAFVIDYGVQLISRNQVQAAVDAAALAGATALAYDSYTDRSATGPAHATAQAVAKKNLVWSEAASVDVDPNVVCESTWEAGASAAPIRACVEVKAFRNEARGNPIPTYIAQLMGIHALGVSAAAIAEAKDSNATDCLKPLAIPDRWLERYPAPPVAWPTGSTFNRWDPDNPAVLLPPATRDAYTPPNQLGAGTGLTMDAFGLQVTLQPGEIASPIAPIAPWRYLPVQIPDSRWGPNAVRENTKSCASSSVAKASVAIGDRLNFVPGGIPANAALVGIGFQDLVNLDLAASWNAVTQRVEGSCADLLVGRCASMSPRVIALALYDATDLADASQAGGATSVLVTNIVGFFIESVAGTDATGRIVRHPGQRDPAAITLFDASSFLRASMLVK